MMTNQYNNRVKPEILSMYLERGALRQKVAQYVEQVNAVPGLCLLPGGHAYAYIRLAGRNHKMSIRSLVYYAIHKKSPVFFQCNCKNSACINPHHQKGHGL